MHKRQNAINLGTVPSIFVRLSGGLGNQLFQVVAALKISPYLEDAPVYLDTRFLASYESRRKFEIAFIVNYLPSISFGLPTFGFASVASRYRLGRIFDRCFGKIGLIASVDRLKIVPQMSVKLVVLDGYFQHPDVLFDEKTRLALRDNLYSERQELLGRYRVADSCLVGIHIRRGDFVTSQAASKKFITIKLDYYHSAIRKFPVGSTFLIFGDDPSITSAMAKKIGGIDVSSLCLSLQDEFCLLASCDHYIIANSTFSWWASYLGWDEGKRIICPRNWYHDSKRNNSNPLLLKKFELI